jgi:hypothetical protein
MRNGNILTDNGRQLLRDILTDSARLAAEDPFFGMLEDYTKTVLLRSLLSRRQDVSSVQKGTNPATRHWSFCFRGGALSATLKASGFPHRVQGQSPDLVLVGGGGLDSALHLEMKAYSGMGAREQINWPSVRADLTEKVFSPQPSADAMIFCATRRDMLRAGTLGLLSFDNAVEQAGGYGQVDGFHFAVKRVSVGAGVMQSEIVVPGNPQGAPQNFQENDLLTRYCMVFARVSLRP